MRLTTRLLCVLGAASLTACGGARLGGGKEGAAQALFGASSASQKASSGWMGSPAAELSFSQTMDCPKGGKVKLTMNADLEGGMEAGESLIDFSTEYLDCSNDGQSRYKGTMDMDMATTMDSSFENIEMTMNNKGRLDITGAISDFIDADVRLISRMSIDSQGETPSATVEVLLDGTITTSSGTYTYDNETFMVSSTDSLPAAQE